MEVDFEIVQPKGKRIWRRARFILLILALPAVWMLGVDRILTIESCPDCLHTASIDEYRFLGISISSKREDSASFVEYIFRDLGRPCRHELLERGRWKCWWGLVYCACPCWNGTHVHGPPSGLSRDETNYQQHVLSFAKRNPKAGDEMLGLMRANDLEGFKELKRRIIGVDSIDDPRQVEDDANR